MERSSLSWKLALENFAITRIFIGVSGKDVIKLDTTPIHEMFALLTIYVRIITSLHLHVYIDLCLGLAASHISRLP